MKYQTNKNQSFIPWQPSTWPTPPKQFDKRFLIKFKQIIDKTILEEIQNVISDATKINKDLQHRGYVVALALLCAVDAISSYAYENLGTQRCNCCGRGDSVGPKYKKFIRDFFPNDYKPFAEDIYRDYRNYMVHSWNLFKTTIRPGKEKITKSKGNLSFGLLNYFEALKFAVDNFLVRLKNDKNLQRNVIKRYSGLRTQARDSS